jgi:DNA-directed RNA polymerase subunit RPC12/RpoP
MSLEEKYPDIAKEFDISKNNITPDKVHSGTPKKFWWICNKDHSWITSVSNRTFQKTGCPYCKSRLTTKENNLLSKYPDIAKEWDYNKNKQTPYEFLPYSNKRVSWICKFGHKWDSIISNRTRQNCNCPICYKNESWCENYIFQILSNFFNVEKRINPEIDIYLSDLNIGIEYDGYYHKFRVDNDNKKNIWAVKNLNILIRVRESYLPELPSTKNMIIIKQKDSSRNSCKLSLIKILELLNIEHTNIDFDINVETKIRNKEIPDNILKSWSTNNTIPIEQALKTHKYLWICSKCESEYESTYRNRIIKDCCPFCSSQKVNKTNSLYHTHKNIIKYISKDNEIDPKSITYGTGKKLKFILNSKEYYTTPRNFSRYIN